jgi:hypothetical protein
MEDQNQPSHQPDIGLAVGAGIREEKIMKAVNDPFYHLEIRQEKPFPNLCRPPEKNSYFLDREGFRTALFTAMAAIRQFDDPLVTIYVVDGSKEDPEKNETGVVASVTLKCLAFSKEVLPYVPEHAQQNPTR